MAAAMSHSHDGVSHSHSGGAADHGHTHEILDGPGSFLGREMPIIEGRSWSERAFTIGIGGCVLLTPQLHIFQPVPDTGISLKTRRLRQNRTHARALPGPALTLLHRCRHK